MGYEIKVVYHPRKEGGGYDTNVKEEEFVKVGKPFDETPLERLAGVVMSQMARRDVFVLADEIEVTELVRNKIGFKECRDGKGIVLKNKKFSFNEAAQLVAEDMGVPDAPQPCYQPPQHQHNGQHQHPHEAMGLVHVPQQHNGQHQHPHEAMAASRSNQNMEDLYANPNRPVPIQKVHSKVPVNQNKVIYKVYLEPDSPYRNEVKRLPAKFSYDKEYPVHAVIPSASGRLDAQKLAVTDDTGKVVEVDEKYFTSVGLGLVADRDNRFSGSNARNIRRPKLAFEDQMYIDAPDPNMGRSIPSNIPMDDGSIPDHLMQMPDIRRR